MNHARHAKRADLHAHLEKPNGELRVFKSDEHVFVVSAAGKERIPIHHRCAAGEEGAQERFVLDVGFHMRANQHAAAAHADVGIQVIHIQMTAVQERILLFLIQNRHIQEMAAKRLNIALNFGQGIADKYMSLSEESSQSVFTSRNVRFLPPDTP